MKTFLRNLILSLCTVLPSFQAYNCVYFHMPEDMRVNNFMSNLPKFEELNSFVFTTQYYNGDAGSYFGAYTENIDQWYAYVKDTAVDRTHIYDVLYSMDKKQYLSTKAVNQQNNTFLRSIIKNKAAQEYLELIKNRYTLSFEQKWDDFAKDSYSYGYSTAETVDPIRCDSLYKICKDPFLKKRYAYQNLICSFYGNSREQVVAIFNKHFQNTRKDWLDYSAQHYYAYGHPKHDSLWLDCIMHGSDKFYVNVENINASKDLPRYIQTEKDPSKRSYLLAVKTLRNPGRSLIYLQQIVTLDPQNRYINFLITREINKIEDWILTPKITGFESFVPGYWERYYEENPKRNNWYEDLKYAQKFLNFINTLAYKNPKDLFLALAKTHLQMMTNQGSENQTLIDTDNFKGDPTYYLQAKVLNLFIQLNGNKPVANFESQYLEILELSKDQEYYKYQFIRTASQLMLKHPELRSKAFLTMAQGRFPKEMKRYYGYTYTFYTDLFENASLIDLDQMMVLIRKKDKSTFETYITKLPEQNNYFYYYYQTPENDLISEKIDTLKLLDIMAMKYIRQDDLEKAYAVYKTFPKSYWNTFYYDDPFTFSIYDGHNHGKHDKAGYTKLTFLEKLLAYKKQLKETPQDPLINYYVGNAYLALTYYGKNWFMFDNYWTGGDDCKAVKNNTVSQNYYACAKAIPYFKIALSRVKEEKLRTLLALNLAYCLEQAHKRPLENYLAKDIKEFYTVMSCDVYESYLGTYRHVEKKQKENVVVLKRFLDF